VFKKECEDKKSETIDETRIGGYKNNKLWKCWANGYFVSGFTKTAT
jgi:hypothetical protein